MITMVRAVRGGTARRLAIGGCAALAVAGVLGPVTGPVPAQARTAATVPPGRAWPSFAYYPPKHQLVEFGGSTGSNNIFGDTWTRTGSTWTKQAPALSPSPRTGAGLVYDPATKQLLLFGGGATPAGPFNGDTWTWNGTTWTQLHPATSPPGREFGDLVYDAATRTVVLFAGWHGSYLDDTWSWDGTNWTQLSPAASPSGRDSDDFVYDPATGTAIMFGGHRGTGYVPGDTWSWDGTNWTQLNPPASPGKGDVAWQGAYDAATSQLLLFGGDIGKTKPSLDGTWEWTGSTWAQLSPATAPPGRGYGSMTYDAATKQVILTGGRSTGTATTYPTTTWAWTGTTWSQI
jgi:hypothetical protein